MRKNKRKVVMGSCCCDGKQTEQKGMAKVR